MGGLANRLADGLATLERESLIRTRRVLDSPQGTRITVDGLAVLNFSSNDYLGLANHPQMRAAAHAALDAWGVGSGASPMVSGQMRVHHEAELRFARFTGLARALLFSSGYAANLGVIAALCDRNAEIFADRLDHACLIDGALLSRAKFTRYPHLDLDTLESRLVASRAAVRLVATDAVFSMDGDLAPVAELLALCERHNAWLLLDDAHGIGVLGARGRGCLEHFGLASPRIVYMATLGKALGGYGAFVGGSAEVIEWLVQRARTYIYSTALPPVAAATAIEAMDLLEADPSIVARLRDRIAEFRAAAGAARLRISPSMTAIHPIVLDEPALALAASARLLDRGYFVPAIRPPSVPEGTSRLRVSLSAAHSRADVEGLANALAGCLAS
ncbi:MAG: 8-amino-7-oxononanoate synthase [Pseudomonadota bacterium]|nr:8-amino-7-oxononanoate synthase [Pseudomonadota bacterium]